jgi:hypothetical protein
MLIRPSGGRGASPHSPRSITDVDIFSKLARLQRGHWTRRPRLGMDGPKMVDQSRGILAVKATSILAHARGCGQEKDRIHPSAAIMSVTQHVPRHPEPRDCFHLHGLRKPEPWSGALGALYCIFQTSARSWSLLIKSFRSDGNADEIASWPIISAPLPIRSLADLRDWPILGSGRNGRAIVMTGST